jgi:hypothetical protein
MIPSRRLSVISVSLLVIALGVSMLRRSELEVIGSLPERLSDHEFWELVTEMSEEGGYFRSDNFVSNESTFQSVIPELPQSRDSHAYIGVGPDQNFTYIVAMQPRLSFIIDIRRQNMLEHLLYKALIEMSETRAAFLANLFSRALPQNWPPQADAADLFAALESIEPSHELFEQNLQAVLTRLTREHGFDLEPDDAQTIEYVYNAFMSAGPDIRYSFPNGWRSNRFPSYSDLMLESDQEGMSHSYMATEDNFQILKRLESENRIIPLVGDFAGDSALRAIGKYLKLHGATVGAFYTSNVEFYLFQTDDWKKFFGNVASMPLDDDSTFIRAYFNSSRDPLPHQPTRARSTTILGNMEELVDAFNAGEIRVYGDVIRRSH